MGDQTTVSYKVYLYKQEYSTPKGQALEVRRIGIDRDVSTSFAYLKEKLASVFPVLGRTKTKYSVVWQDEENEWITIRSDEELVIALTEMAGPVYKLHVQFQHDENDTKSPSIFDLMGDCTIEDGVQEGETHPGVTCDGCEKPVVGFRYKCVQCPDYDLCERCEAKRVHPGHNMMRISTPESIWPQHFFRRLNKMHDRINKRAASASAATEAREEEGEFSTEDLPRVPPFGCGRGRHAQRGWGQHGRGRFAHGRYGTGGAFPPGGGQKWFDAMMKGWTGEGQFPGANLDPAAQAQFVKSAHDAAHQAAHTAASHAAAATNSAFNAATGKSSNQENVNDQSKRQQQSGPPRSQSFEQMFQGNNEFLANVGNMVAAALDPFGINVQVDIEAPNGQRTTCGAKASSGESTEATSNQKEEKKETENDASSAEPVQPSSSQNENKAAEEAAEKEANMPTPVTIEKEESDDDEFEFLNKSPEARSPTQSEAKEINIPIQIEQSLDNEHTSIEEQKGEPSKHDVSAAAKQSDDNGARNVPINVVNQPANVLYGAPNGGPLYPELPRSEPTPSVSTNTNGTEASAPVEVEESKEKHTIGVAKHKDPRIQVALQAMLNMGFKNDGGWLTQLLEAKEGDIGKALDVLQPVNPNSTRK